MASGTTQANPVQSSKHVLDNNTHKPATLITATSQIDNRIDLTAARGADIFHIVFENPKQLPIILESYNNLSDAQRRETELLSRVRTKHYLFFCFSFYHQSSGPFVAHDSNQPFVLIAVARTNEVTIVNLTDKDWKSKFGRSDLAKHLSIRDK